MANGLELKDIITLLIAAYAAVLSTFNWRRAVRNEKRRVLVKHSGDFLVYPNGNISTQLFSIKAVNVGHRTVVVTAPAIRMPDGKFLNPTSAHGYAAFPKRLEDGENAEIRVEAQKIADALITAGHRGFVTLRPACYDKTDTLHLGKKWRFDTDNPAAKTMGFWKFSFARLKRRLKKMVTRPNQT